ncbi:MAG: hypothetical protein JWP25_370 [Bradyrhizobium sp.]|nr:hypothetical protein [Bradyrhizobium sp.]
MEKLFAVANVASRIYALSWRRGNIIRAQNRLREPTLSRRLINFYLDEIELEINHMLSENSSAA